MSVHNDSAGPGERPVDVGAGENLVLVRAGGRVFAVARASVREVVAAEQGQVEAVVGGRVLRLRERLLPLVDLACRLGLGEADPGDGVVVVLAGSAAAYGLLVDAVEDTCQTSVQRPSALAGLDAYAGVAVIDGTPVLVLDADHLAPRAGDASDVGPATLTTSGPPPTPTLAVLVMACAGARLAVPLTEVARVETFPAQRLETVGTRRVVQYDARLLQLRDPFGLITPDRAGQPVSVVVQAGHAALLGLVVDDVVDIVDVAPPASRVGQPGTVVIDGLVAEFVHLRDVLVGDGDV